MKNSNGWRVEPAPTCAWRRISVRPTTEISADSLSASCQTLPKPGNGEPQRLRDDDPAEEQRPAHADRARGLELAAGDRVNAPRKTSLWYAPEMMPTAIAPGRERVDADESLGAEEVRERRQRLAPAEVEEIDHEEVRNSAQHRRRRRRRRVAAGDSLRCRAHATSAPSTLPSANAVAETAIVISVACAMRRPQPLGPKPISST